MFSVCLRALCVSPAGSISGRIIRCREGRFVHEWPELGEAHSPERISEEGEERLLRAAIRLLAEAARRLASFSLKKCLPFEEKRAMYVLRMSERTSIHLPVMEKVVLLREWRTCTDRREQVIMPASIIQGVCAAKAASGSPVYLYMGSRLHF